MIKHTLQEIADFFDCWVAFDETTRLVYGYKNKPTIHENHFDGDLIEAVTSKWLVSNAPEDWKDSLTAPSEPPFKEGELVYGTNNSGPYIMTSDRMINSAWYRRPTEAEWKTLRGEE